MFSQTDKRKLEYCSMFKEWWLSTSYVCEWIHAKGFVVKLSTIWQLIALNIFTISSKPIELLIMSFYDSIGQWILVQYLARLHITTIKQPEAFYCPVFWQSSTPFKKMLLKTLLQIPQYNPPSLSPYLAALTEQEREKDNLSQNKQTKKRRQTNCIKYKTKRISLLKKIHTHSFTWNFHLIVCSLDQKFF